MLTKGSRYLKPRFEIIFAIFMLLYVPPCFPTPHWSISISCITHPRRASFSVPIVIYYVVLHALPDQHVRVTEHNGRVVTLNEEPTWQARAASLGVLLGLLLFGWGPFFLWKANVRLPSSPLLQSKHRRCSVLIGIVHRANAR